MTFPKRESEPTTTTDAVELSNEELSTIDGGFVSFSVGCTPSFVASPFVVGAPVGFAVVA